MNEWHYFTCKYLSPVWLCHRSVCNGLFYRTIARSLVSCDNVLCFCIHLQPECWRLLFTSCNGAGWTSGWTVTKIPLSHIDITWPAKYKKALPWNALCATHYVRSAGVYTFYMFWLLLDGWYGHSGTSFPYYENTDFLVTRVRIVAKSTY